MIKSIHLLFVFVSFASFSGRMILSVFNPSLLKNKILKIAPHIFDTVLLVTGITLVIQGNWLDREFGWIISKLILLIGYIVFGVMAMRLTGIKRWFAFLGALSCFISIFMIAISKNGFI